MIDIFAILMIVGYFMIGLFIASILTDDPFTLWGAVIMMFWPVVLIVLMMACVGIAIVSLGAKFREFLDL